MRDVGRELAAGPLVQAELIGEAVEGFDQGADFVGAAGRLRQQVGTGVYARRVAEERTARPTSGELQRSLGHPTGGGGDGPGQQPPRPGGLSATRSPRRSRTPTRVWMMPGSRAT